MNREPGPEIFEQTRSGSGRSAEQLVAAVSELAQRDPRRARRAIETVAAHLDEATQGKRTAELERLEAAALQALGLDAKHMLTKIDASATDAPAADEGPAAPPPGKQS